MSLGYADRLSFREDLGGQLGSVELFESPGVLRAKVEELARWVAGAKKVIVFTGAGISTACGIPDFRCARRGAGIEIVWGQQLL